MNRFLEKLNYKGQQRIAFINAGDDIKTTVNFDSDLIRVDTEIDPRYPYELIIVFVTTVSEIDHLASLALHNLICDGTLWFCFPRKTSRLLTTDIEKDKSWDIVKKSGLKEIRKINVDDDWAAIKFRNARFVKSSGR